MTEPGVDLAELRRRVLLTGIVCLVLFGAAAYLLATLKAPDVFLLVALVVIYVAVARPMLTPVRAATRLRKDLAYRAFLDSRQDPP
jgi:hypothetical protein